jgi:MFS family permease
MKPIYRGWSLVAIAFATNLLVYGTTYTGFQLFVLPVSKDYGLSRADMNTAMVFLTFGSAIMSPALGRLVDLVSPRKVMLAGVLMLSGSLAGLGFTHSVWVSAAIFALPLAASIQCAAQLTLPLLVNRWFVRWRGRAMALAIMGISTSFVVMAPTITLMIERFQWRTTLLILAGVVLVVLGGLGLLIRDQPAEGDVEPGAADGSGGRTAPTPAGPPLGMLAILRMPQFWTIGLGTSLAASVSSALVISLAPIAVLRGLTPLEAAGLVSLSGMAGICGKLTLTVIADRVNRIYLQAGVFMLAGVANAILLAHHGAGPILVVCAAAFGVSNGVLPPLLYAILGDRFGAASFGTAAGLVAPISLFAAAFTTRYAGEVFDHAHNYDAMHLTFVVMSFAAGLIMLATRFTRTAAERA